MSKYIKLGDAIYVDCILINEIECEDCPFCAIERSECRMFEWLESLPTIDIVRCKDCKHCLSEEIEETMPIYIYCDLWKGETEWDSFCSYGERIEE